MYSLISGLVSSATVKPMMNILIVGCSGSGKTCFVERLKLLFGNDGVKKTQDELNLFDLNGICRPTIGCNMTKIQLPGWQVRIWDLGGRSDLRPLWVDYYSEANGLIFVIDCSSEVQHVVEATEALGYVISDSRLNVEVPVMIVCNKEDVHEGKDSQLTMPSMRRLIQSKIASVSARDVMVTSCSAHTGDGIQDCFNWLIQCVQKRIKNP